MENPIKPKTKFKQTEIGRIPEEWEKTIVGLVCNIKNGKTNSQDAVEDGEYPFFDRSLQIKRSNKYLFDCEAIIIPGEGKEFIPRYFKGKFDLHQRSYAIWRKEKEVNLKFIYYWILKNRDYLARVAVGSTVGSLRLNHIQNFQLGLPPLPEQRAIAKVLSAFDDKIELLQKMNKTLEAIGQAIFKHWFIDFEFPNEQGKPYKSSNGEMVFNEELGKEIPKGWRVGRLGDVGDFKNGINYLRDEKGDMEFSIVNVRDIANNKFLLKEQLDKINIDFNKAKEYLLERRDIIIARSAIPGEVSLMVGDTENVIFSGFSIRLRLHNPNNWLYIFFTLQNLKQQLANFSIGTTIKSVNQESLKSILIVLPSEKILNQYNKISEIYFNKIAYALTESHTLSQIRDLLLPKLMSGKIRVPLEDRK
ncbi:MAG: restriction endonuclease subunit S [Leptonema sp. (in: bacteria)]